MAETNKAKDFLDQFLTYGDKVANVYSRVKLADQGVATPVFMETNGAGSPTIEAGKTANVKAEDGFTNMVNNAVDNMAMAYTAKQANDSLPYIIGMMALGITIFLLTKK